MTALLCGCNGEPAPIAPAIRAPAAVTTVATIPAPAPDSGKPVLRIPQVAIEQVTATLKLANSALSAGMLEQAGSPGPGALELFLAVRTIEPENVKAKEGLMLTFQRLMERDLVMARSGHLAPARRTAKLIAIYQDEHPGRVEFTGQLAGAEQARKQVTQAQALAKSGKLLLPEPNNAVSKYRQALASFADFAPALQGLERLVAGRLQQAESAAARDDFASAERYIGQAQRIAPESPGVVATYRRVLDRRQQRSDQALALGHAAVDKLAYDQATALLTQAMTLWPQAPGLEPLRLRIELARHYGAFKPGQTFSEILAAGGIGPEMRVVPRGVFQMGSADNAENTLDSEKPQRQVRFLRGFAISRSEITVADFRRFIEDSGYKTLATRSRRSTVYDERGGNLIERRGVDWRHDQVGGKAPDNQPVLHVAFEDAMAYAQWLSRQTGQRYRLPTEAEWEYVLRAGSSSQQPWGEGPPTRLVGNLTGDGDVSPRLKRQWGNPVPRYRDGFWGPAPAGSFPEEGFGTMDMIGNVAEWTLDCWHDSYRRAPDDGSAWVNPGCEERVIRGASWSSAPEYARSAYRTPAKADTRNARLGIRLVREI